MFPPLLFHVILFLYLFNLSLLHFNSLYLVFLNFILLHSLFHLAMNRWNCYKWSKSLCYNIRHFFLHFSHENNSSFITSSSQRYNTYFFYPSPFILLFQRKRKTLSFYTLWVGKWGVYSSPIHACSIFQSSSLDIELQNWQAAWNHQSA